MVIDREIKRALIQATKERGNLKRIAAKAGFKGTTFSCWKCGHIDNISEVNYERLYPHIAAFLPDRPEYYPRAKLLQICNSYGWE